MYYELLYKFNSIVYTVSNIKFIFLIELIFLSFFLFSNNIYLFKTFYIVSSFNKNIYVYKILSIFNY